MKTEIAKIISNRPITGGIYDMWIKTTIAKEARCGQFIGVYPKDGSRLLQRPISICRISDDKESLRIVYRVAGKGTDEISSFKTGEDITILGPCGNGFDPDALQTGQTALLLGGGIGLPPMLQLGYELKNKGLGFKYVLGYRDSDTFMLDEYEACAGAGNVIIATDDGSKGVKGTVIDAINANGLKADVIYACGPMPMLCAVKQTSEQMGATAFISLEERMACGVGACLGCVCKTTKKDDHSKVNNARVCVEGPVFRAEDVQI